MRIRGKIRIRKGEPARQLVSSVPVFRFHTGDFVIRRRDGSENFAQKMNLRSSSLCPDYCHPFTLSKVGEPPALKLNAKDPYLSAEREIRFCRHLFTSSLKCKIMQFHVEIVQKRQRNIQKSVMHAQSCRFPSKPIVVVVVVVFFNVLVAIESSDR